MDGTQGTDTGEQLELTPEQRAAEAEADALFEAGYNDATGDTPGTVAPTSTSTTATASAAAATGDNEDDGTLETDPGTGAPLVQPGADASDDDAPVTITKRQLASLTGLGETVATLQAELRKTVDSTNGRIGSIQQRVKEVAELAEKAGQGIRPSFDDMAELEEDFPEMAAVLKRNLERMYGIGNATTPDGEGGGAGADQGEGDNASGAQAPGAAAAPTPMEDPAVKKALRDAHLALVDKTHEGWRALPATPDWQTWANQLPDWQREILRTTRDAATLNDAISDFKAFRQRQAAAASASNQRGNQLERAIPATTGSSTGHAHSPSEDELFEAGFKNARQ